LDNPIEFGDTPFSNPFEIMVLHRKNHVFTSSPSMCLESRMESRLADLQQKNGGFFTCQKKNQGDAKATKRVFRIPM